MRWGDANDSMTYVKVISRSPGKPVLVATKLQNGIDLISGNFSVPVIRLWTANGARPCARAALCLFGRIGNKHGKFDVAGSSSETLTLSAPSIYRHLIDANPEFEWDIFGHTWDEQLAPVVRNLFMPRKMVAEQQPKVDNVQSFGETVRRTVILMGNAEVEGHFQYDLVVLMRFDILLLRPLRLADTVNSDRLWTGHWCSIHSKDLAVREVVLNLTNHFQDERYHSSGIFAPSQFSTTGLHDFWFAGSSHIIRHFANWGQSIGAFKDAYGLSSDEIPVHCGHFYTFLYAKHLGLALGHRGVSYIDYTLARYQHCEIVVGNVSGPADVFCSHWEISVRRMCGSWVSMPAGWAHNVCPLAGLQASLAAGSTGCGRF